MSKSLLDSPSISANSGQVIEVVDSQEDKVSDNDDWTEEDMELPVMCQPISQGTMSKSLLDSPSISANMSRTSSISSLTSDSEPDQRTTQEIKRDLALAEVRANKLRREMDLNVKVLGSQALFHEMTSNRQAQDSFPTILESESIGLNQAGEFEETEPIVDQNENSGNKVSIDETETIAETEEVHANEDVELDNHTIANETEPIIGHSELDKDDEVDLIAPETEVGGSVSERISITVPESDDEDLFSQTPDEPKLKVPEKVNVPSPVTENTEDEISQIIKPTNKVDTSNCKFHTSNLIPAVRKKVPEFIASLNCKGLVGKVDDSVTHIIVSTGEELEAQRTLKYLQGVASGVMIVSHLWVEACLVDRDNLGRAEKWEVTDEELMGANGPWRARKSREEGQEPLLAGFQVLIDGDLEGLDTSSVEDLLARVGARAVPDKNSFSFTSEVTRLVLVDSTANIGVKIVGKLLKNYRLAMVDKDWLLDSIGGHSIKPILNYTVSTIQKLDLERVGYSGALLG